MEMGRFDEATAEMKRAQELDPLSLNISMIVGARFYFMRQYDQAIEQLRKTVELDPNFVLTYDLLSGVYMQKGMYDEAIAAHLKGLTLEGYSPEAIAALKEAYAASGMRGYRQKYNELLKERSKQSHVSPIFIAMNYALLVEKDRAFEWLEKAYEERSGWLLELKVDPVWDSLRSDPRFADLVRRIGLPQ